MHYVCADIHGNWEKYQAMLKGLNLGREDRLYILGDAVDRGAGGIRILQDIMCRGNFSFVIGNHELFLYGCIRCGIDEWMDSWLENGGQPTAEAFLKLSSGEQDEILDFLEDSYAVIPDLSVEGKHYYLVHAFPDLYYMEQPVLFSEILKEPERLWKMVWERIDGSMEEQIAGERQEADQTVRSVWEAGRTLLVGHTITTQFSPISSSVRGHARIHHGKYFTGLDCGCAGNGDLACLGVLRLEDGKEFYY